MTNEPPDTATLAIKINLNFKLKIGLILSYLILSSGHQVDERRYVR